MNHIPTCPKLQSNTEAKAGGNEAQPVKEVLFYKCNNCSLTFASEEEIKVFFRIIYFKNREYNLILLFFNAHSGKINLSVYYVIFQEIWSHFLSLNVMFLVSHA